MTALYLVMLFFFFKQKTAYEMRISDWSSDVCSSDLTASATATASAEAGAERGDCTSGCEALMGRNPGGVSGRMTRPAGGILRLPRPAAMQLCLPRMGQSVDSTRPRWHARLQSEEMKSSKAKAFEIGRAHV